MTRLVAYADVSAFVVGLAAVEYGVGCWSAPAAWVLGGVVLMACAVWPGRKVKR